MYDLTQLEQAGFQFTPFEKAVFNNPSFQLLHRKGWPIKWGRLTTGLIAEVRDPYQNEVISFKPVDGDKLTPNGAGNFFDDVSAHIRSVSVLVAKVARDASNDEFDQRLVQDLYLWLDGVETPSYKQPFRWIEFERKHKEKMKQEARAVEVAALSQGDADVIVLLLNMIVIEQRELIRKAVKADCIKRKIFDDGDEHKKSQHFHFPWPSCVLCNEPPARSGWRHCDNFNSIILVNCGDVPTIVKSIPVDFRRIVKPVRFKVPRSTFSDRFIGCVGTDFFPQFTVFSFNPLSREEQQKFQSELEKSLRKKQAEWSERYGQGHYYSKCQVIAPTGWQRLNALLLAGPAATWNSWRFVPDDNEFCRELLRSKKINVELID